MKEEGEEENIHNICLPGSVNNDLLWRRGHLSPFH